MSNMQEIRCDNRFENFFNECERYFRPIDFAIKIILGVIILFLLLELVSFVIVEGYKIKNPSRKMDMDIYEDKGEARDFFKELRMSVKYEYYPYVGFRGIPNYSGKFINTDENSRRVNNYYCNLSGESITIFVFGGSTVWGEGVKDNETIPFLLSESLCKKGIKAKSINFGERAYVNSQELIQFQLELIKGNIPDIVIFYDGINEVYSAGQSKVAGFPQNIEDRQKDFNSRNKLNLKNNIFNSYFLSKILSKFIETKQIGFGVDENLENKIIQIYLGNIKIIKALEKEFGFKSFFYWQPSPETKNFLSQDEETKILRVKGFGKAYIKITEKISKEKKINDLSDIFDEHPESIFIDWAHVSSKGNEIIVNRIVKDMETFLNFKSP